MLTFESDCPKTMFLPVPAAGYCPKTMFLPVPAAGSVGVTYEDDSVQAK
nr:hypothetical protein [Escherichia coli]